MKRRRATLPRAAAAAYDVIHSRGITTPEQIDVEKLVADFWIKLRRAPIDNAEGRLLRAGSRGVVTVDVQAFLSEKWRFVIAHELGHFLLHEWREDLTCFPKKNATREDKSRSFLDEEAASGFASTLLMPDGMVRERYDGGATPMERATLLAKAFGVSLPMAALRMLDFTEEACAVAYVEAGVVGWCTATKAFGVNVGKRVEVGRMAGGGETRTVDIAAWGKAAKGVGRVYEQTVALTPFDASVTVLWHDAIG
jgi:hypothetical protein